MSEKAVEGKDETRQSILSFVMEIYFIVFYVCGVFNIHVLSHRLRKNPPSACV